MSRGRKPSDVLANLAKPEGRDVIWAQVRKLKTFTTSEINLLTDINLRTIDSYLIGLEKAEFLSVDRSVKHRRWTLERDNGIEAPRVRTDGKLVTQGSANENMWRTMKILREFTFGELAGMAATPETKISDETAKSYCNALARAGYLAVLPKSAPNQITRYRFARDTGPKPPQIQRVKLVFDPNTKEQIALDGGEVSA